MSYTTENIRDALESRGELLLTLESDAYPDFIELHLHDTAFDHDNNEISLELADGEFGFKQDAVESIAVHKQTTDDLGF